MITTLQGARIRARELSMSTKPKVRRAAAWELPVKREEEEEEKVMVEEEEGG